MKGIDTFLGKWMLNPDRSNYELGEPPQSGTYEILEKDQILTFKMAWKDSAGDHHEMEYSEICDGKFHEYPVKEIADELCLRLKSESLLESIAKKGGKIVLSAKRELITDTEMKVTMSGRMPEGKSYDNVSWYSK